MQGKKVSNEEKETIRDLVLEEIPLYRSGQLERFTSNLELGELIDVCKTQIPKILKGIPKEDLDFRRDQLKGKANPLLIQPIYELIQEEIDSHKKGLVAKLTPNPEIMGTLEVSSDNIKAALKLIPTCDQNYRSHALMSQNGISTGRKISDQDIKDVVEITKKEILDYQNGDIDKLTTNVDFANMLDVNNNAVRHYLRRYLSKEEFEYRRREIRRINGRNNGLINGSESGRKCVKNKTGIFAMSPEEMSENSRMIYENGLGIHGMSIDQRRAATRSGRETMRKNSYSVEGRFYSDSLQEGASALLLEKYLPEKFGKVEEGKNFQVHYDNESFGWFDFVIGNEILEWHPIRIEYDSKPEDRKTYREINREAKSIEERKDFNELRKSLESDLAVDYWVSRQEAAESSGYKNPEVFLATNQRELYDFMLKHNPNIPSYREFRKEFKEKIKYVKSFKVEKKEAA